MSKTKKTKLDYTLLAITAALPPVCLIGTQWIYSLLVGKMLFRESIFAMGAIALSIFSAPLSCLSPLIDEAAFQGAGHKRWGSILRAYPTIALVIMMMDWMNGFILYSWSYESLAVVVLFHIVFHGGLRLLRIPDCLNRA